MSTIDRERAIIAHFPIGAAIRGDDVDWSYIEVELAVGFEMGQTVADLAASVAYKDAFSQPIAAPAQWVATSVTVDIDVDTSEFDETVTGMQDALTAAQSLKLANDIGGWHENLRKLLIKEWPSGVPTPK